jgi:hypothetical protein
MHGERIKKNSCIKFSAIYKFQDLRNDIGANVLKLTSKRMHIYVNALRFK